MNKAVSTRPSRVLKEVKNMEPSARKQKILSEIVERFIQSGEPVGSKSLLNAEGLSVSSATVRNDMAELTEKGYIVQPHTSAGRIPTQTGYRYYVDNIMKLKPISERGREYIRESLEENSDSPESILQSAADVLARLTSCAALATTPNGDDGRIRRISFVATGAHTGMAVVIASTGVIQTKLFRCDFLLTPELLGVFEKAFNDVFAGIRLSAVNRPFVQTAAANFGELSLFMTAPLMAIMEACEQAARVSVCHSGFGKLMSVTGMDLAGAHRLWEFLQNEHDLAAMLLKTPQNASVAIGAENSRVELANSSVSFGKVLGGERRVGRACGDRTDANGLRANAFRFAMRSGKRRRTYRRIDQNIEEVSRCPRKRRTRRLRSRK